MSGKNSVRCVCVKKGVLHVETPLGIVNIRAGLRDGDVEVAAVELIPGEGVKTDDGLCNIRFLKERILDY